MSSNRSRGQVDPVLMINVSDSIPVLGLEQSVEE